MATRHDLAGLEQRIDLRFERVEERFERVEERIKAAMSDLRATFEHELGLSTRIGPTAIA